jgi:hypothetical protein
MLLERDSFAIGDTTQSPVDGLAGYTQPTSLHARTHDRHGDARDPVLQVVRRRRPRLRDRRRRAADGEGEQLAFHLDYERQSRV